MRETVLLLVLVAVIIGLWWKTNADGRLKVSSPNLVATQLKREADTSAPPFAKAVTVPLSRSVTRKSSLARLSQHASRHNVFTSNAVASSPQSNDTWVEDTSQEKAASVLRVDQTDALLQAAPLTHYWAHHQNVAISYPYRPREEQDPVSLQVQCMKLKHGQFVSLSSADCRGKTPPLIYEHGSLTTPNE